MASERKHIVAHKKTKHAGMPENVREQTKDLKLMIATEKQKKEEDNERRNIHESRCRAS
jgi:hypothetical protein